MTVYTRTEAERLRAQARRCEQLAREAKDESIANALMSLATKSLEQASNLERRAGSHR